ncbi:TPA: hypothetical protein ACH3X3_000261 [Trebouxia sp. C0006]
MGLEMSDLIVGRLEVAKRWSYEAPGTGTSCCMSPLARAKVIARAIAIIIPSHSQSQSQSHSHSHRQRQSQTRGRPTFVHCTPMLKGHIS